MNDQESVGNGGPRTSARTNKGNPPERLTYGSPFGRGRGTPVGNPARNRPAGAASSTSSNNSTTRKILQIELEKKRKIAEIDAAERAAATAAQRQLLELEAEVEKAVVLEEEEQALGSNASGHGAGEEDQREVQNWVNRNEGGHYEFGDKNEPPFETPELATPVDVSMQLIAATLEKLAAATLGNGESTGPYRTRVKEEYGDKYQARKLTKELNYFHGEPENWSLFIAEYERTTELCGYTAMENVSRLQKALKGKALATVKDLLINPNNLAEVMTTLKERFGRPELVVKVLIEKAKKFPPVRDGKPESLAEFSDAVRNIVAEMKNSKCTGHLTNPQLLEDFVSKLSAQLQFSWAMRVADEEDPPDLEMFSYWLKKIASAVIKVGVTKTAGEFSRDFDRGKGKTTKVLATSSEELEAADKSEKSSEKKPAATCPCCKKSPHPLSKCTEFSKKSVDDRWSSARKLYVCYGCLNRGHQFGDCRSKKICGKNGCTGYHHGMLHRDKKVEKPETETVNVNFHHGSGEAIILGTVPVTLVGPYGEYETYALMDSGSAGTFVDARIAEIIGATGPRRSLRMKGVGEPRIDHTSMIVELGIRGINESRTYQESGVRTVKNLELGTQSVDVAELLEKYPQLKNLERVGSMVNVRPMVLIGEDKGHLFDNRRPIDGPAVTKTRLGWMVHGRAVAGESGTTEVNVFRVDVADVSDDSLHQLVKEYFTTEEFGVKLIQEPKRSAEDTRAQNIMDSYSRQVTLKDGLSNVLDKSWMFVP
jgi:hypothetical protein